MSFNTAIVAKKYYRAKSEQLKYDKSGGEITYRGVTFKDSNKNGELDSGDRYIFGNVKGTIVNALSGKPENSPESIINAFRNFFESK